MHGTIPKKKREESHDPAALFSVVCSGWLAAFRLLVWCSCRCSSWSRVVALVRRQTPGGRSRRQEAKGKNRSIHITQSNTQIKTKH